MNKPPIKRPLPPRHFLDRSRIRPYPLRHPKPSDKGAGMTVCIASRVWTNDDIVSACDRLLSFQDFASDNAADKFMTVGTNWMVMFAARDISPVTPIYELIGKRFKSGDVSLESMVNLVSNAYIDCLKYERERRVLYHYGLTADGFATSSKDISEDLVRYLNAEIAAVNFDVEILAFGHDEHSRSHIFSVANPGIVSYHDIEGYHAIGVGAWAAHSSLMQSHSSAHDLRETVYEVCAAKMAAERTGQVGKETYLLLSHRGGPRKLMYDEVIIRARNFWNEKQKALTPTDEELRAIDEAIKLVPKDQNIIL